MFLFFFFKQKTAYEMRISDWSSDVCSSDLGIGHDGAGGQQAPQDAPRNVQRDEEDPQDGRPQGAARHDGEGRYGGRRQPARRPRTGRYDEGHGRGPSGPAQWRSEEHTSELQSLMRRSYAVFWLKTQKNTEK